MTSSNPSIPSPVPYLLAVEDFRAHNTVYDWSSLFLLVLMAIGCGRGSPLAVAHWIEDHREWLIEQGFGRGKDGHDLPSQATIYRFVWGLEENIEALETALSRWAEAVVEASGQEDQVQLVNVDGKHLKGSARGGRGDRAIILIAGFLEALGLTLWQQRCEKREANEGREVVMQLEGALSEVRWCLTGDAALSEAPLARAVLKKGGATC